MANHYDVPSWAGKPPIGTHLDVLKEDKLIQKLMLDEKKCYLFGRNPQMCDFCIDHQSCSRVHAAFVYHKTLGRAFLVDLGSTHGTYIGSLRLEAHKPTPLSADTVFHFGASTRNYIMRQRPQTASRNVIEQLERGEKATEGGAMLGLPESETELDNLTEFNTAHNRRISMLGIGEDSDSGNPNPGKRKRLSVSFNEDEEIINLEDIDPNVGRFRNMVHSMVIPAKRKRGDVGGLVVSSEASIKVGAGGGAKVTTPGGKISGGVGGGGGLYGDMPGLGVEPPSLFSPLLATRLGICLPNPAPEVSPAPAPALAPPPTGPHPPGLPSTGPLPHDPTCPSKKKYAKEAWPGKKSLAPTTLLV